VNLPGNYDELFCACVEVIDEMRIALVVMQIKLRFFGLYGRLLSKRREEDFWKLRFLLQVRSRCWENKRRRRPDGGRDRPTTEMRRGSKASATQTWAMVSF